MNAMNTDIFAYYPSAEQTDTWTQKLLSDAGAESCSARRLPERGFTHGFGLRHCHGFQYVQFYPEGRDAFYTYWQPAPSTPAPLLVHVPGYGAEMNVHPELVSAGYNVLEISPLGYATPHGPDEDKKRNGVWPVLPDTVLSGGEHGYCEWLKDCLHALWWAQEQPHVLENRVSFFGTSQGGGAALLLASILRGRGVRCAAADVPFLTDFRNAGRQGAYDVAMQALDECDDQVRGWYALGLIDTIRHAHRLDLPVLLTAGGKDGTCPPDTIEALFNSLPGTRSFTYLKEAGHGYTQPFMPLAQAWFRLYG